MTVHWNMSVNKEKHGINLVHRMSSVCTLISSDEHIFLPCRSPPSMMIMIAMSKAVVLGVFSFICIFFCSSYVRTYVAVYVLLLLLKNI